MTCHVGIVANIRIVEVGHFLGRRAVQGGRAKFGHVGIAHGADEKRGTAKSIRGMTKCRAGE